MKDHTDYDTLFDNFAKALKAKLEETSDCYVSNGLQFSDDGIACFKAIITLTACYPDYTSIISLINRYFRTTQNFSLSENPTKTDLGIFEITFYIYKAGYPARFVQQKGENDENTTS